MHTLKQSDAEALVEFLRRVVSLTNCGWWIFHKHSENTHQWNAYDSGSFHIQSCDVSPVRTAMDHMHVSTYLGSIHLAKRAMQSFVFFIVYHPLSVNVHALKAVSVIYNITIEWYVTYRLVWMKFPEHLLWNKKICTFGKCNLLSRNQALKPQLVAHQIRFHLAVRDQGVQQNEE